MGSGNSRLSAPEGEPQVPQNIKTSLMGRVEDFRKRRNGEGTLSKKQLLKDSDEIDVDSQSSCEIETEENNKVLPKETQPEPPKEEPVARVTTSEKLSRVVPMPNLDCEIVKENDLSKGNVDPKQDKVVHVEAEVKTEEGMKREQMTEVKTEEEKKTEQVAEDTAEEGEKAEQMAEIKTEEAKKTEQMAEMKTEEAEKTEQMAEMKTEEAEKTEQMQEVKTEEEKKTEQTQEVKTEQVEKEKKENDQEVHEKSDVDDEDDNEECGRLLCPGSPSFRIYCIEAEKRKDGEECKNSTIIMHQKSHSADSVETAKSMKSRSFDEVLEGVEIEPGTKRKVNKKKFGAMKTLMKVRSCYHPMCTCAGYDRNIVVAEKASK